MRALRGRGRGGGATHKKFWRSSSSFFSTTISRRTRMTSAGGASSSQSRRSRRRAARAGRTARVLDEGLAVLRELALVDRRVVDGVVERRDALAARRGRGKVSIVSLNSERRGGGRRDALVGGELALAERVDHAEHLDLAVSVGRLDPGLRVGERQEARASGADVRRRKTVGARSKGWIGGMQSGEGDRRGEGRKAGRRDRQRLLAAPGARGPGGREVDARRWARSPRSWTGSR